MNIYGDKAVSPLTRVTSRKKRGGKTVKGREKNSRTGNGGGAFDMNKIGKVGNKALFKHEIIHSVG